VKTTGDRFLTFTDGSSEALITYENTCKEPVAVSQCFGTTDGRPAVCGGTVLRPGGPGSDVAHGVCGVRFTATTLASPASCRDTVKSFRCSPNPQAGR
jgi:hypothetical protein